MTMTITMSVTTYFCYVIESLLINFIQVIMKLALRYYLPSLSGNIEEKSWSKVSKYCFLIHHQFGSFVLSHFSAIGQPNRFLGYLKSNHQYLRIIGRLIILCFLNHMTNRSWRNCHEVWYNHIHVHVYRYHFKRQYMNSKAYLLWIVAI